jgi:hypothetical protein
MTPPEDAAVGDQNRPDRDAAFLQALAGLLQGGLDELVHVRVPVGMGVTHELGVPEARSGLSH